MWPEIKLVHGRARHPESKGSVERANADVKKMLATWMRENKSLNWSIGIQFVQLKKNHSFHTGSSCSPYKATFGIETPLGLQSTVIPVQEWGKLETARQLFEAVGMDVPTYFDDDDDVDKENDRFDPNEYGIDLPTPDPVLPTLSNSPHEPVVILSPDAVAESANILIGIREHVRANQRKQARRMQTRSAKYWPEVEIGDYVTLPVADVDRGPSDPPNIICRVIDIDYNHSLYELACRSGVLNIMFARNCFDLVEDPLDLPVSMDKSLGIREAVKELSIGGGQGMLKCNCTSNCIQKRCSCRKSGLLCNSRCHGGNSLCKNK